jgi:hypothetical protein
MFFSFPDVISSPFEVDLNKLLSWTPPDRVVSWNRRDTILYALGVGVRDNLSLLYEKDENFKALPTLLCAMSFKGENYSDLCFDLTRNNLWFVLISVNKGVPLM